MGIPREHLPGSHSATEFVGWYNAHPDFRSLGFDLSSENAAVVGNGNVAMDLARILASPRDVLAQTDIAEQGGTVGARLRSAWIDREPAQRLAAMRSLWIESDAPHERHARLILTAGAAARIPPSDAFSDDSANLIAAMLTAGMDRQAARWAPLIEQGGEGGRAWAMLAVATPRPMVSIDSGRLESFAGSDDSRGHRRSQLLVAALAGLDRIDAAQAAGAGFRLGEDDRWTRAIDRAARERSPGTVALLAGVGMQTANWSGVPPPYLFRIVRALRAVGMDYEARMIAAEALARL